MGLSLLGYFFYIVTAFTAAMALLISFDDSSLIGHHNPRPAIVVLAATATATATQTADQHLAATPESQSANHVPANDVKTVSIGAAKQAVQDKTSSRTIALAKLGSKKNERQRLARLEALKVLARFGTTRSEGHRFGAALGYAEGPGYRPGLDSQR